MNDKKLKFLSNLWSKHFYIHFVTLKPRERLGSDTLNSPLYARLCGLYCGRTASAVLIKLCFPDEAALFVWTGVKTHQANSGLHEKRGGR